MGIVQSDIVRFIILILPGLWGLWIYRALCKSGKVEENELDYGKAAGFGILGYFIAPYFATALSGQFCVSVIVSMLLAIILGSIARLVHMNIVFLPSKLFSKVFATTEIVDTKNGIYYIWEQGIDYKKKDNTEYNCIARVHSIVSPSNILIGEVKHISQTNEIVIDKSPIITDGDLEKWEEERKIKIWCKNINLDSGMVAEIAIIEKKVIDDLYNEQ